MVSSVFLKWRALDFHIFCYILQLLCGEPKREDLITNLLPIGKFQKIWACLQNFYSADRLAQWAKVTPCKTKTSRQEDYCRPRLWCFVPQRLAPNAPMYKLDPLSGCFCWGRERERNLFALATPASGRVCVCVCWCSQLYNKELVWPRGWVPPLYVNSIRLTLLFINCVVLTPMRAAAGGSGGRAESQVSKSITAGHRGSGKLNWFVYQGTAQAKQQNNLSHLRRAPNELQQAPNLDSAFWCSYAIRHAHRELMIWCTHTQQ